MASILTPQGMFLATAMAVSGSVILLALRLQKSTTQTSVNPVRHSHQSFPRPCLSSDGKKQKKKKRVHFAEDVVDPSGNSEEYRRTHRRNSLTKGQEMPANRVALYNGILKDRVLHRVAYSH